ncbi:MAG: Hsp70 family protein [Verrucomicrobiales bacterium]|nr:Hsp70 family protein [Verrucomicrobiales bacterium]
MIGIDLGTTNSLVAVLRDGQPVVLENELGETLTPSAVAIAGDGALLVGRAAKDRLVSNPLAGQAFFKRDMGTEILHAFGGREWSPIELSAVILKEMKRIAEVRLGQPVDRAVITVPAYFHDLQRQATLEAAQIAGLKVERLLNEPTAAALAYGFQKPGDDSTLLVFDLGGGTFDVTLLEVFDGVVEVKASAGVSRLGGEDYTDALAMWIARHHGWNPEEAQRGRWRHQVELLKRRLTTEATGSLLLGNREIQVGREEFRSATVDLTARLWPVVRRCLRDAGVTPKHISAVLLVGGASRMPLVCDGIRELLDVEPRRELDPDRVVALGAAVQQALCVGHEAVGDLVLTDVCPHTLGLMVCKEFAPGHHETGYFEPLIDRNTAVPVSRSKLMSTLHPQQEELRIQIFQGESRMVAENQKIGEVLLKGLRHKPGQKMPGTVDVRFTYDMNGLLEVEVTILSSGRKVAKVFQQRPGTMTEDEIAEAIARLAPIKTHPRDNLQNRSRLERANRLYAELIGDLRHSLSELIDRFEAALTAQDRDRISQSGEELDSFMAPFFTAEEEGRE